MTKAIDRLQMILNNTKFWETDDRRFLKYSNIPICITSHSDFQQIGQTQKKIGITFKNSQICVYIDIERDGWMDKVVII